MAEATLVPTGKMRSRLQLLQPTATQDSYQDAVAGNASVLGTVWAEIRELSGHEIVVADAVEEKVNVVITIRYFKGLTGSAQATCVAGPRRGHSYDLMPPTNPDGQQIQMRIYAWESVPQDVSAQQ